MRKLNLAFCLLVLIYPSLFGAPLVAQAGSGTESLGVQVTDRKGKAIANAHVFLELTGSRKGQGLSAVATDAKGRAVLAGLSPGTWQIEVEHPEYLAYVAVLTLERGRKPAVVTSFLQAGSGSLTPMRVKLSKAAGQSASPPLPESAISAERLARADVPPPVLPVPQPATIETELAEESQDPSAPEATEPASEVSEEPTVTPTALEMLEKEEPARTAPVEATPAVTEASAPDVPEEPTIAPTALEMLEKEEPVQPAPIESPPVETEAAEAPSPPAIELAETEPVEPEPVVPEPIEPEPVVPEPMEKALTEPEPAVVDDVVLEPAMTEATEPATPESPAPPPAEPEATAPEPAIDTPVVPEPVASEPVVPEPVVPESAVPEPVVPEPVLTEPTAAEPLEPPRAESPTPTPAPLPEVPEPAPPVETPTAPETVEPPAPDASAPAQPEPESIETPSPAEAEPATSLLEEATDPSPPAPEVTRPEAATPVSVSPAPGNSMSMVRSQRDGSCSECRDGEWAVASTRVAAAATPGATGCNRESVAAGDQAMRALSASIQLELASFIGPAADGSPKEAIRLVEPDIAETAKQSLASMIETPSSCQVVGAVLPKSVRFVGFKYEVADDTGEGDCVPGQDCRIGNGRWLGRPVVEKGSSATVVYGVFENNSADHERLARLIVYFRAPNSSWRPPGYSPPSP